MEVTALSPTDSERFVSLLTSAQDKLYRYILVLVAGQHERAKDILQEANLVLWRKASSYQFGTDFDAWAKRIAHYCVLSEIRDRQRKPLLFGEKIVEQLYKEYGAETSGVEERQQRLQNCLKELPKNRRSLIRKRYLDNMSVSSIAKLEERSAAYISSLLYRLKLALIECVGRKTHGQVGNER